MRCEQEQDFTGAAPGQDKYQGLDQHAGKEMLEVKDSQGEGPKERPLPLPPLLAP